MFHTDVINSPRCLPTGLCADVFRGSGSIDWFEQGDNTHRNVAFSFWPCGWMQKVIGIILVLKVLQFAGDNDSKPLHWWELYSCLQKQLCRKDLIWLIYSQSLRHSDVFSNHSENRSNLLYCFVKSLATGHRQHASYRRSEWLYRLLPTLWGGRNQRNASGPREETRDAQVGKSQDLVPSWSIMIHHVLPSLLNCVRSHIVLIASWTRRRRPMVLRHSQVVPELKLTNLLCWIDMNWLCSCDFVIFCQPCQGTYTFDTSCIADFNPDNDQSLAPDGTLQITFSEVWQKCVHCHGLF